MPKLPGAHSQKPPRNPNRPPPGATIKVEPIRTVNAINRIKRQLEPSPRNHALFVLGINTAFRAGELLSIRTGQVRHIAPGDRLDVKQSKTRRYRAVTLNRSAHSSVQRRLEELKEKARDDPAWFDDESFLFSGRSPDRPLTVPTVSNLVKSWCQSANLKGNYGSHTLRKTWGYMQRKRQNTPVPLLMRAFGHASQRQTLEYLCIQEAEIDSIYTSLEL